MENESGSSKKNFSKCRAEVVKMKVVVGWNHCSIQKQPFPDKN